MFGLMHILNDFEICNFEVLVFLNTVALIIVRMNLAATKMYEVARIPSNSCVIPANSLLRCTSQAMELSYCSGSLG